MKNLFKSMSIALMVTFVASCGVVGTVPREQLELVLPVLWALKTGFIYFSEFRKV